MTTATAVLVDRVALEALILEAEAVGNVLAWLGGGSPAALTEELEKKASRLADQVIGEWPAGDDESDPRWRFHESSFDRARELLRDLAGEEGS